MTAASARISACVSGRAGSAGAVAEVTRDLELDHALFADELHPLGPAGDHAAQWKLDRLAPLVGAVKYLAAVEPTVS